MPEQQDFAVLPDGTILDHVHNPETCTPPCVLHSPTKHHMSAMHLHWRQDRGMFERICEHGVGHPDPDQVTFWRSAGIDMANAVHGCDGCCRKPDPNYGDDAE